MDLRQQLISFEGWCNKAYPDPLTRGEPFTIGVGHTGREVKPGLVWTDEQVSDQLDKDIAEKTQQCRDALPWFERMNEPRQAVVIGMAFQMGIAGLLQFHRTLDAMRDEQWPHAANCMLDSQWARQTPKRAARLARQVETGEWQ